MSSRAPKGKSNNFSKWVIVMLIFVIGAAAVFSQVPGLPTSPSVAAPAPTVSEARVAERAAAIPPANATVAPAPVLAANTTSSAPPPAPPAPTAAAPLLASSAPAATSPAAAQATTPAATPMPVAPATDGLSSSIREMSQLERDVAVANRTLQLLTAQAATREVQTKLNGVATGTNEIPELVGIVGVGGQINAEFLVGTSILKAREGDWVTPEWRVARLLPNGVELSKRGGREVHTVFFGHRPIEADGLLRQGFSPVQNQGPIVYPGNGATALAPAALPVR